MQPWKRMLRWLRRGHSIAIINPKNVPHLHNGHWGFTTPEFARDQLKMTPTKIIHPRPQYIANQVRKERAELGHQESQYH